MEAQQAEENEKARQMKEKLERDAREAEAVLQAERERVRACLLDTIDG